jgi:hypothetical protein
MPLAAARKAVEAIEEEGATRVATLAARLGSDSASSIERAMRNQTAEIAGHLEQSAAHAAGLAKEAATQLRSQMAQVDTLAENLERRVTEARARAEEQVDNDFARRVALITETLNSNAIDIAKALDAEVGETAWAAYLRGERGSSPAARSNCSTIPRRNPCWPPMRAIRISPGRSTATSMISRRCCASCCPPAMAMRWA